MKQPKLYRPRREPTLPRSILRERGNAECTIESAALSRDDYGEPIKTWSTLATRRGLLLPFMGPQRATRAASHTLSVRYFVGADRDLRVQIDSVIWEVHDYVNVDNRNREIILWLRSEDE